MSIYLYVHGAPRTAALACEKHALPSGQDGTQKQPLSLYTNILYTICIYIVCQYVHIYMARLGRQLWLARNMPHHPARMGPTSSMAAAAGMLAQSVTTKT